MVSEKSISKTQKVDLILVVFMIFMSWHTNFLSMMPVIFMTLRLIAALFVIEKRKDSWLPILLFSSWMIGIILQNNHLTEDFILNPFIGLSRLVFLSIGCTNTQLINSYNFIDVLMSFESKIIAMLILVAFFIYILFLFLFPIISYIRMISKKELSNGKYINKSVFFIIAYLISVIVIGTKISEGYRYYAYGMFNIVMFLMSGLPLLMYIFGSKEIS